MLCLGMSKSARNKDVMLNFITQLQLLIDRDV